MVALISHPGILINAEYEERIMNGPSLHSISTQEIVELTSGRADYRGSYNGAALERPEAPSRLRPILHFNDGYRIHMYMRIHDGLKNIQNVVS